VEHQERQVLEELELAVQTITEAQVKQTVVRAEAAEAQVPHQRDQVEMVVQV
jgi:hypothetical protein